MKEKSDFKIINFGGVFIDWIYYIDSFPEQNSKKKANDFIINYGGPAFLASNVIGKLSQSFLKKNYLNRKINSVFISFISDNDFNKIDQILKSNFVKNESFILKENEFNTPRSTILIEGDSRTIIWYNKNLKFSKDKLWRKIENLNIKKENTIFLFDGQFMDYAIFISEKLKKLGIKSLIDAGSVKENEEKLIKNVSFFIGSEDYFFQKTGIRNPTEKEGKEFIVEFKNIYNNLEFIGFSFGERDFLGFDFKENRFLKITPPKVKVIDTTGAGDFLHGAFLFFLVYFNFDIKKAIYRAIKLASISCEFEGSTLNLDKIINKFLKEFKNE